MKKILLISDLEGAINVNRYSTYNDRNNVKNKIKNGLFKNKNIKKYLAGNKTYIKSININRMGRKTEINRLIAVHELIKKASAHSLVYPIKFTESKCNIDMILIMGYCGLVPIFEINEARHLLADIAARKEIEPIDEMYGFIKSLEIMPEYTGFDERINYKNN